MARIGLISIRIAELFGMEEDDYLKERLLRGYSARAIARELGVSNTAVTTRLRKRGIAETRPNAWVMQVAA